MFDNKEVFYQTIKEDKAEVDKKIKKSNNKK